jgi:hypothetical protein
VANLVVQGFQLDGVNAHDAFQCSLIGLTCRGNGRAGITVAAASRVAVDGCLLGDNARVQLLTEGYSHTVVRESTLLPRTAPEIVRLGGRVVVEAPPPEAEPQPMAEPQPEAPLSSP